MQKLFPKAMKYIFVAIVLYITIFLVFSPKSALSATRGATKMCIDTLIPSLFPFFVCSGLLSSLGFSSLCSRFLSPAMRRFFNLPGCSALAFFLGLVSGYPVGAYVATELYSKGQCTKAEAEHMIAFCNNSGPLFVIGVVGTAFLKSPAVGYCLYGAHILSAIVMGFVFRMYKKRERGSGRELPPSIECSEKNVAGVFGSVIDNSVFSTLKVCGFVVFFSVFTSALPEGRLHSVFCAIMEITGGINKLSQIEMAFPVKLSIISFFLAFSGLSVFFQVSAIATLKGISLMPYIFGKIFQGLISAVLINIILKIFPIDSSAFSFNQGAFLQNPSSISVFFSSVIAALFASFVLGLVMWMIAALRKK